MNEFGWNTKTIIKNYSHFITNMMRGGILARPETFPQHLPRDIGLQAFEEGSNLGYAEVTD